jgi:hypothetical protein
MRTFAAAFALLAFSNHARAELPQVIDGDERSSAPEGYHVEHRPRTVLAIVGGTLMGVGAATMTYGFLEADRESRALNAAQGSDAVPAHGRGGVLVAIGVLPVVAGFPMLLVGLLRKDRVYVRNPSRLTLNPSIGRQHVVGTLSLRF